MHSVARRSFPGLKRSATGLWNVAKERICISMAAMRWRRSDGPLRMPWTGQRFSQKFRWLRYPYHL
ncbi:hypothetical protein Poly30_40760 [Planctomycetes bacterium Poly30]|uniref:Uncharacterized protein n=1 Tax=Saltatorellus ferox TaxID=2528018 RepID=A0A518EWS1_9BACT|nr:hypothetical protein Poly30_40760 [Planctomycetes bacterium Poly30]